MFNREFNTVSELSIVKDKGKIKFHCPGFLKTSTKFGSNHLLLPIFDWIGKEKSLASLKSLSFRKNFNGGTITIYLLFHTGSPDKNLYFWGNPGERLDVTGNFRIFYLELAL